MNKRLKKKFTKIAQEILNIKTLERRWSDTYDFNEVSVWSLKKALKAAYDLGVESQMKKAV